MDKLLNSIKTLVADLRTFETEVALRDRNRTALLDSIKGGYAEADAVNQLRAMIAWRRELHDALDSLDLALKNGAATFARFDKKAEKDAAMLAEALKKGGKGFSDDDPILVAQRQAFKRAAQKLDFAMIELEKLRDILAFKWATRSSDELRELQKALHRDLGRAYDDLDTGLLADCKSLVKRFEFMAEKHHLE